jgi:hypothetical protein
VQFPVPRDPRLMKFKTAEVAPLHSGEASDHTLQWDLSGPRRLSQSASGATPELK